MTFISYAQNMEDVMLWRALKHVVKGFYIDIGANDPNIDSVTKAFYKRGWRGINIEPVSQWFEKLEIERPRDINLQLAVGAKKGELTFYEIPDTGLSTLDKKVAERHQKERGFNIIERQVPVETLKEICSNYHVAPIHFMKIDVEGAEKKVLEGFDFSETRPWIILIESTLPNTQTENHEDWESMVLANNYTYVYFDGLNRYYVADEHPELIISFKIPPNLFDGFIFSGEGNSSFQQQVHHKTLEVQALSQEKNEIMERSDKEFAEQADNKNAIKNLTLELKNKSESLAEHEVTLAEQATQIQTLDQQLITNHSRIEELAAELAISKFHNDNLALELASKNKALIAQETTLAEKTSQIQTLDQQLATSHSRIEELVTELAITKSHNDDLALQLESKAEILAANKATLAEQATQIQTLGQQLIFRQSGLEELTVELANSNVHGESLAKELVEKNSLVNALENTVAQLQAHSQWLESEWNAAKAKNKELNHFSHHWWTVADGLNHELQRTLNSKSWRVTWPLRKLMLFSKRLLCLLARTTLWAARQPKRTARWMLVKLMAYTQKHPLLKERALTWLQNYPAFEVKLRQLALARGLKVAAPVLVLEEEAALEPIVESVLVETTTETIDEADVSKPEPDDSNSYAILTEELSDLTPRARRIYMSLVGNQKGGV